MSNCPHISSLYLTSYLNHHTPNRPLQSPSEKAPSQGMCLDPASLLTVNVTCNAFPKRSMTPPPKLSPVVAAVSTSKVIRGFVKAWDKM
ncbi:hypothetical protein I7I51_02600 [Histoplasma capsulatum]|uniref:Uncharacterized protein n=1 Tax=Ajellomyces capsulatus TaxID=5037 RepID=A0A8A1MFD7_AJECA|nr:hypothetical protein I7I51_02600 [Histoplasma capsulatum]